MVVVARAGVDCGCKTANHGVDVWASIETKLLEVAECRPGVHTRIAVTGVVDFSAVLTVSSVEEVGVAGHQVGGLWVVGEFGEIRVVSKFLFGGLVHLLDSGQDCNGGAVASFWVRYSGGDSAAGARGRAYAISSW